MLGAHYRGSGPEKAKHSKGLWNQQGKILLKILRTTSVEGCSRLLLVAVRLRPARANLKVRRMELVKTGAKISVNDRSVPAERTRAQAPDTKFGRHDPAGSPEFVFLTRTGTGRGLLTRGASQWAGGGTPVCRMHMAARIEVADSEGQLGPDSTCRVGTCAGKGLVHCSRHQRRRRLVLELSRVTVYGTVTLQ